MALAVTVNFTILDSKGKSSVTKVRVPTGFSIPQYGEFAVAMAQLISAISQGSITDVSIGLPLNLSAATIRSVAISTANVAEKALFMVRSVVSGLFGKFFLPTYNDSLSVTGSDDIDQADPDVAAYMAILEDGVNTAGGVINPVDLRENDLSSVTEAREIFRRFG